MKLLAILLIIGVIVSGLFAGRNVITSMRASLVTRAVRVERQ